MARIAVHVTPKSARSEIAGWRGAELAVRVTAPPEGGKANAAVCRLLAEALGVPKSSVRVTRGDTSRHKTVELDGVESDQLAAAFGQPQAPLF
jgi:hypothetical protein